MIARRQFSLAWLLACTAYFAVLSALAAGLTMTTAQAAALFLAAIAPVVGEWWFGIGGAAESVRPTHQRLAYFLTACAIGMMAALIIYGTELPHDLPPWMRVESSNDFLGLATAFGHAIVMTVYLYWASVFSFLAFAFAVCSARRSRLSFCLTVLNLPGFLLFSYLSCVLVHAVLT